MHFVYVPVRQGAETRDNGNLFYSNEIAEWRFWSHASSQSGFYICCGILIEFWSWKLRPSYSNCKILHSPKASPWYNELPETGCLLFSIKRRTVQMSRAGSTFKSQLTGRRECDSINSHAKPCMPGMNLLKISLSGPFIFIGIRHCGIFRVFFFRIEYPSIFSVQIWSVYLHAECHLIKVDFMVFFLSVRKV